VTQGAPEYDVLWVVDTTEHFGEYVPYRDYDPRPVVGSQGLIAVAWHRSYEQYAGVTAENIKFSAGLFDYLLGELNQFNP
jgi:hypothetical protein